jgi:hypothetical protein
MARRDQSIEDCGDERLLKPVIVAKKKHPFAGVVAAVFKFVKPACMPTFGACPAITSPGNVRIVVIRMDSATSKGRGKNKLSQDGAEYSVVFEARVAMHIKIFIATRNKEDE